MFHIRDYRPEDETQWLKCRALSFLDTAYYDDVSRNKPVYENPSIELVAILEGQLVGLLDIEYETSAGTVCSHGEGLAGMIWELAVHPDHRRRGIASSLLAQASPRLKQAQIVRLQAWTRDDECARGWYRKHGFAMLDSYLHVYVRKGEGGIISTIPGLTPINSFAHYTGSDTETIRKKYSRVHECCLYELGFANKQ